MVLLHCTLLKTITYIAVCRTFRKIQAQLSRRVMSRNIVSYLSRGGSHWLQALTMVQYSSVTMVLTGVSTTLIQNQRARCVAFIVIPCTMTRLPIRRCRILLLMLILHRSPLLQRRQVWNCRVTHPCQSLCCRWTYWITTTAGCSHWTLESRFRRREISSV